MTGVGASLRARAVLDRQFTVAVLALVVLAAVGGWATYGAYGAESTTTEQREVTVWEATGEFSHGATVVGNASDGSTVLPPGTTVENQSFYYTRVMPELDGEFAFEYAAEEGELDATIERTLLVRSVGERSQGTVEYWRETRRLGRGTATLEPGETARVPFTLNVTDAVQTARDVRSRLGDPGQTRIALDVTVALSGTVDGREVERNLTYALPVNVGGGIYRVDGGATTEAFTRTEEVTVPTEPDPFRSVGGPIVLGLAALGLVVLFLARRQGHLELTPEERAWLDYRDDRSDFEDWITTIRLPEEASTLPVAEAATLADLADFAIDTDNSVLESPDGGRYHVVHDGYRYTFEAPPEPGQTGVEAPAVDGDSRPEPHEGPARVAEAATNGGAAHDPLRDLRGVGPTYAAKLREAGIERPADLVAADSEQVAENADLDVTAVETLAKRAAELRERERTNGE